ncbi:MAG: flagellar biosynthesis protein FliQ [Defluviitaleaceae bacterium]|nr:flagellar biosynthesis protein FliQ [Defluviitaleaceae bacterium]
MAQEEIIRVMQDAIWTVILTALPPLLLGLVVGLIVALFQAVTSIQEATLAFVPKIFAVFLALMIFGGYMIGTLTGFVNSLFEQIPYIIRS